MHLRMKIPRHTSKNPIAAGDFTWIFARNCEETEQLPYRKVRRRKETCESIRMILADLAGAVGSTT